MKKAMRVITVIMIVMMLTMAISSVFAVDPTTIKGNTAGTTKVTDIGSKIVGFLQVAGSVTAVAILVVLGIKYMLGSAEEKAEYKKTMIPYIIGAILIFAASTIAGVVYNFANQI